MAHSIDFPKHLFTSVFLVYSRFAVFLVFDYLNRFTISTLPLHYTPRRFVACFFASSTLRDLVFHCRPLLFGGKYPVPFASHNAHPRTSLSSPCSASPKRMYNILFSLNVCFVCCFPVFFVLFCVGLLHQFALGQTRTRAHLHHNTFSLASFQRLRSEHGPYRFVKDLL